MNLSDESFGLLFLIMGVTFMLMALTSKAKIVRVVGFVIGAVALWIGIYELLFVVVGV